MAQAAAGKRSCKVSSTLPSSSLLTSQFGPCLGASGDKTLDNRKIRHHRHLQVRWTGDVRLWRRLSWRFATFVIQHNPSYPPNVLCVDNGEFRDTPRLQCLHCRDSSRKYSGPNIIFFGRARLVGLLQLAMQLAGTQVLMYMYTLTANGVCSQGIRLACSIRYRTKHDRVGLRCLRHERAN